MGSLECIMVVTVKILGISIFRGMGQLSGALDYTSLGHIPTLKDSHRASSLELLPSKRAHCLFPRTPQLGPAPSPNPP